jgi:quinol-cytochrome oxidoreductase complex cytochrome b subunit
VSDAREFVAAVDSDQRRSPTRVVFVTRRTSAHVKVVREDEVQTFPVVLFRAALGIELLAIVLVVISLFFNAPLEGIADPSHTPNPAKAPWYFLGLQELLHYFPPVVAGVLVPTVLIVALVVIPYFNVNIEAQGLFLKDRRKRVRLFYLAAGGMLLFLLVFKVYVAVGPTLIVAGAMAVAGSSTPESPSPLRRYLAAKPLAYWVMTWFLFELIVLTVVGTFFRGPGWSWALPWRS